MSLSNENGNKSTETFLNKYSRVLFDLFIPILVGVFLLFVEYKTGFFVQTVGVTRHFWPTVLAAATVAIIIFTKYSLFVGTRSSHYTRERFSLAILPLILSISVAFIASIIIRLMPWNLILYIFYTLLGEDSHLAKPGWAEITLLSILYVFTIRAIFRFWVDWDGKKSIKQYQQEQRNEPTTIMTLIGDGFSELARVILKKPPLEVYRKRDSREFVTQLESVSESLSWKDQAKELIRLSSSVYDFRDIDDWHDKPGCWIGKNVKTNELVCLIPIYSEISDFKVKEFYDYATRFARDQQKTIGEIIIASKHTKRGNTVELDGTPVRFETEDTLLSNLVDFRDYINDIKKRVYIDHLSDSRNKIEDIYVPSRCLHSRTGQTFDNVEKYLTDWLDEPGKRHIALLGEYGQGKSTCSLMLTYHLLYSQEDFLKRIPILIELRGKSPRNQTRLGLLGEWAAPYRIDPQALERLLEAGRLLIIFEGFDEMALIGDSDMRLEHFKVLWSFSYPKSKIMITGRPNFFLDEEEMRKALGISEPSRTHHYCDVLRLEPFTISQIENSLRSQKNTVKDQICSLAKVNQRFYDIVSRPSLLHIVSELWEKEKLSEDIEKLNSAYVMGLFIRHSYLRQGLKEDGTPSFMALNTSEREYFMRGIAAFMASNRLPNQISGEQLNKAIETLLDTIPNAVSEVPSAISGEADRPLKIRLAESEYGTEHVKVDVRACGILVDDPSAPGTFRFGHKSFMEYLVSSVIAEYIIKDDPIQAQAIMRSTNLNIEDILFLPVSIEFLAEMITSDVKSHADFSLAVEQAQRSFVSRLFQVISGGRGWALLKRISLFEKALSASGENLPKIKRWALSLLSPSALLMIAWVIFGILSILSSPSSREVSVQKEEMNKLLILMSITVAVMTIAMTFGMWVRLLVRQKSRHAQQSVQSLIKKERYISMFGLWNLLCKKVGIQDEIMHKFAGTWMFPWARNQVFDYFLPDEKDKPSNPALSRPASGGG